MLILARRLNEKIVIGDDIQVSVVEIKGDQVKLGIDAPREVKVYRQEVFDAIQEENRSAARSRTGPGLKLPSLPGRPPEGSERSGDQQHPDRSE
jgi:carbon storage regulator